MSDYNSSLPIRTENDGDVIAKIADATTPSQQLKVEADGSINVNADITATDLDIRDLDASQDNVAISDGTDTLAINADGSINITDNGGSLTVDATDLDIRNLVFADDKVDVSDSTNVAIVDGGGSITVDASDLDIRDIDFLTDSIDVSGSSNVGVVATDLDIRDLSASSDSVSAWLKDDAGNAFSSANPLPVEFFESITEAFDYNTGASIASNASSTHTYSAPANFKIYEAHIAGSGKMKAELKINAVTVAVGFNSTANPNIVFKFEKGLNASSVNIAIVRTNLDNQAQDLYSTISGASN